MGGTMGRDDLSDQSRNGTQQYGQQAKRSASRMGRTTSEDFSTLITDVEELLRKVGHLADSEVARVRDRVQEKVASVKETLATQRVQIGSAARNAAGVTNEYVRENPWQSTGVAALAGVILGFVLFRRS